MENIVIELSRYSSNDSPSNSIWTNNLSRPVTIEQGDELIIKQAFIDTRQIDQASIEIPQDIEWTLQFTYYLINHGINLSTYTYEQSPLNFKIDFTPSNPDGLPYFLNIFNDPTKPETPFWETPQPLIDSFIIKIPKGIYEKTYLAEYITRQMQQINRPQNQLLLDNYFTNGQLYPSFNPDGSFQKLQNYNPPPNQNSVVTTFQKPLFLAVLESAETLFAQPVFLLTLDGTKTLKICGYMPLVNNDTIPLNYNYPITNYYSQLVNYNSKNNVVGTIVIGSNTYNLYDAGFVGASEMALVFNDQSSNKYSFQYMHSPIVNTGNEVVGLYITNSSQEAYQNNRVSYLSSYSGILLVDTFTNITQKNNNNFVSDDFFDLLGLNYNDLISPDIKNIYNNPSLTPNTIDYNNFRNVTTRNFYPQNALSDISNDVEDVGNFKLATYASLYSKTGYTFIQSNTTDEIVFSNEATQSITNAGHYLIDVKGYENNFIGEDKDYQIKAVIGNYFLSGDSFCQSLAPDSISVVHEGVSFNLSRIQVRILNPITKDLEVNVGPNSTIYLQIIKVPKQNQVKKIEKKTLI